MTYALGHQNTASKQGGTTERLNYFLDGALPLFPGRRVFSLTAYATWLLDRADAFCFSRLPKCIAPRFLLQFC